MSGPKSETKQTAAAKNAQTDSGDDVIMLPAVETKTERNVPSVGLGTPIGSAITTIPQAGKHREEGRQEARKKEHRLPSFLSLTTDADEAEEKASSKSAEKSDAKKTGEHSVQWEVGQKKGAKNEQGAYEAKLTYKNSKENGLKGSLTASGKPEEVMKDGFDKAKVTGSMGQDFKKKSLTGSWNVGVTVEDGKPGVTASGEVKWGGQKEESKPAKTKIKNDPDNKNRD